MIRDNQFLSIGSNSNDFVYKIMKDNAAVLIEFVGVNF